MNTNRLTFDRQLGALRDQVLHMSEMIEQAITLSGTALTKHDLAVAQQIDAFDQQINAERFLIEEHAYELLARQQPNARDMRQIVAGVSVVNNLERIGGHCAGIGRLVIRLGEHPAMPAPLEFESMATICQWITRNAMTAFATFDEDLAQKAVARDDEIDALHDLVSKRLLTVMSSDVHLVEAGTLLLWVSHNYERIGDRATNIARRVDYLVKGELVHSPEDSNE